MARGCVAALLTRSPASDFGMKGEEMADSSRRDVWLKGETLLRSSFLFRLRGRVGCFECSRVRRFAPYPLARWIWFAGRDG
jgi:hypothetical protein